MRPRRRSRSRPPSATGACRRVSLGRGSTRRCRWHELEREGYPCPRAVESFAAPRRLANGFTPRHSASARSRGDTRTPFEVTEMSRTARPFSRSPRFLLPLLLATALAPACTVARAPAPAERHLLYVASPGTRNYVEYGGVGILVFDIDDGYRFVRRIPTWTPADGKPPE